jgi:hypothetical protein
MALAATRYRAAPARPTIVPCLCLSRSSRESGPAAGGKLEVLPSRRGAECRQPHGRAHSVSGAFHLFSVREGFAPISVRRREERLTKALFTSKPTPASRGKGPAIPGGVPRNHSPPCTGRRDGRAHFQVGSFPSYSGDSCSYQPQIPGFRGTGLPSRALAEYRRSAHCSWPP